MSQTMDTNIAFFFLPKTNQDVMWGLEHISKRILQPTRDRHSLFTWVFYKCLIVFKPRNLWRGIPRRGAWDFNGFPNACSLILQVSSDHGRHTLYAHTQKSHNI